MTITVELNVLNWGWICLGIVFLAVGGLSGLGVLRPSLRIGKSPLATALLGTLALVHPLLKAVSVEALPWGFYIGNSLWLALLMIAARLEYQAKRGLPHNHSLQPTVDPAGSLADAKAPSASTASEPRR